MARIDVTQEEVLGYLVRHLRLALDLNERNCFETINPMGVKLPPGGEMFVTVAPGKGQFVVEEQAPEQCTEQWDVIVTVYSRIRLDSTGHDQALFRDAARGLLGMKRKVLEVTVGVDLATDGHTPPAQPDTFLRQWLHAVSSTPPDYDAQQEIGWLSITFGVDYDWQLVVS